MSFGKFFTSLWPMWEEKHLFLTIVMIDFLKGPLFNLAINLMGSTKRTSGDSLTPLGAQYKGFADIRDRSLFIAGGGGRGEDLGLNKVKFSRSPLWMLVHWSDPPNNVWWPSRSPHPHMSSFSKEIWVVPPLNPSKVFSDPHFWVLSYDWSPLKSSPLPQGDK